MKRILKSFCAALIALLPVVAVAQIDGEFVKPRNGKFLLKNQKLIGTKRLVVDCSQIIVLCE